MPHKAGGAAQWSTLTTAAPLPAAEADGAQSQQTQPQAGWALTALPQGPLHPTSSHQHSQDRNTLLTNCACANGKLGTFILSCLRANRNHCAIIQLQTRLHHCCDIWWQHFPSARALWRCNRSHLSNHRIPPLLLKCDVVTSCCNASSPSNNNYVKLQCNWIKSITGGLLWGFLLVWKNMGGKKAQMLNKITQRKKL